MLYRASPSLILSHAHSSQYHFSHCNSHILVSLPPHSSRNLHHTTKSPSCNWLLHNLYHSSRATPQPSPSLQLHDIVTSTTTQKRCHATSITPTAWPDPHHTQKAPARSTLQPSLSILVAPHQKHTSSTV